MTGTHTGSTGWGVLGRTQGTSNLVGTTRAGVVGDTNGAVGVLGASTINSGVAGMSLTGAGGYFKSPAGIGVRAQGLVPLWLEAGPGQGAPDSGTHQVGEVVVDSVGDVFVCTTGGSSPTWKKVSYDGSGGGGPTGGFTPIDPVRIVDTRPGEAPDPPGEHKLTAGEELLVAIRGVAGVPESATAVTLNITVVGPTADGYMSVYPANITHTPASPPTTSNVNFSAGAIVANLATVKLAATGPNAGKIKAYNSTGDTHVILDVAGYYA